MRRWIALSTLFFVLSISYCQNGKIDSLLQISESELLQDSINISVLSTLQKALSISKESGTNYRMEEICITLGEYFSDYGLYEDGIKYYKYIFTTNVDTVHKSKELVNLYRKIGQCYSSIGNPDSAYYYYSQIFDDFEFPERLDVLRDLVDIYAENNEHRKSLKYNSVIKDLLHTNNSSDSELSKVYNNIGFNYHSLKEYESSVHYFDNALNIFPSIANDEKSIILRNLAVSYFNLGDFEKSIELLNQASELIQDDGQLVELYHLLASVHTADNDFFNALTYLEKAEERMNNLKNPQLLSEIYAGFSTVYNATHEYDLAYDYFQNYSRLSDSLRFVNQLNQKRIIDNQKYIERTEKENKLLKANQDYQVLKISQLQVEARNQTLRNEALIGDSIQRVNELALAKQENEIAKATEENNILEINRQKNLIQLTNQQLEIARGNEANATIEQEKQQKEFELAQQTINLQERDAQLKEEKIANEEKAREIELSKTRQRNAAMVSFLMAGFVILLFWAYRGKRKDNKRITLAYNDLTVAQDLLKTAETKIKGLLSQQVSGAVAEALINNTDPTSVEERFVCVMFIDIRNFTGYCEGREPSVIIEYQNSVFGFMINIIEQHHGVVNQLLGDGFMATFGAPFSKGNDCLNAFEAANKILKALEKKVIQQEIFPTKVGIGLHAGNVVTGNVGNEDRKQYSITGNTVILAARLEQLNKVYGSSLVYSKEVYDSLPDFKKKDVNFESVIVKGRSQPIEVVIV